MIQNSISKILKAYNLNKHVVKKTPLEKNIRLSKKYNCNIFLKREDLQDVRSFKIRGAFNKINTLREEEKKKGIVCASAGNHAQGVAYSCNKLDIVADIFVPENTPLQKIESIKKFSNNKSKLHIKGATFDESYNLSQKFSKKNGSIYIHPFADEQVIIGQGTIAVEIYNDIDPDYIIGSIGGGGLMSGLSLYSKAVNLDCKLLGVEPEKCNSMYQSVEKNKVVKLDEFDSFVDGAAVKVVSESTFNICKETLDDIFLISNGKLCTTMLELYQNDGIITEPAGALSISALDYLKKEEIINKNIVCVISGGNNDITRYPEINDLALRYKNLKHYFIIKFTQKPGELKKFLTNILGNNDDITRFEYIKKTNTSYGQVLVGIQLSKSSDLSNIKKNLKKYNFNYIYVNENDLLMSYLI